MAPTSASKPGSKKRRNPKPCDTCSRQSVRCQPSQYQIDVCQRCVDFDEVCTINRTIRKRGPRPKHVHSRDPEPYRRSPPSQCHMISSGSCLRHDDEPWSPPYRPAQDLVIDLAEVFFNVVYPIFPLFHHPTLLRRISRAEHLTSRPFYASVMAMCALSAARQRDCAQLIGSGGDRDFRQTSETFFKAAKNTILTDAQLPHAFDYMRASILLAVTAIQYGRNELLNFHLGNYHTLVAANALHDEKSWPTEASPTEIEERRRLYWSAYTLDVFAAVAWNSMVRSREGSSNVAYPTMTDEALLTTPEQSRGLESQEPNWLSGWNFVTDLYRILEHTADDLRRPRQSMDAVGMLRLLPERNVLSTTTVTQHILQRYNDLSQKFKITREPTGNPSVDLMSFQAANIAATTLLVRMAYLSREESLVEERIQVATDLLTSFRCVPIIYLRAISVPLLHHLASIGTILGQSFREKMSKSAYQSIRTLLLSLADFLSSLEDGLLYPPGTGDKLKAMVMRSERYLEDQQLMDHDPPLEELHWDYWINKMGVGQ